MAVIDLTAEREVREIGSEVADLTDALNLVIQQLDGIGDSSDSAMLAKRERLLSKKAGFIKRLKAAQIAERNADNEARLSADRDDRMGAIPQLREATKAEIRTWLKKNDYYYTHADATYWLYSPRSEDPWSPHARSTLVNHDPRLDSRSTYFDLFTEVLQEDKRWFRNNARTFAKVGSETLNMLRWNFLQPQEGEPHWVFDMLLTSLAGGKRENIEHIEQVLVAKWNDPSNYTLPTIVIADDGGTGKSLFAEKFLPVLFGEDLVAPNVAMDEITGQFNGHLMGKAVWFINENRADKNDHDGIKRILGSKTIRSERKGKDAMKAANTALVFVVGNFTLGAIKLSGTEVDRRFSILKNSKPLFTYTREVLSMTDEEAKMWMWNEGQKVISDPTEVAKWLNHILNKHGKLTSVLGLHGDDYKEMLEGQADTATQVFRMFFQSEAWVRDGYFKQGTMFNYYADYCRKHTIRSMSNQRFYSEAEAWLKRNEIPFERKVSAWGDSTASLFIRIDPLQVSTSTNNDYIFFTKDANERTLWKVEID
jgi:hypothetical protein